MADGHAKDGMPRQRELGQKRTFKELDCWEDPRDKEYFRNPARPRATGKTKQEERGKSRLPRDEGECDSEMEIRSLKFNKRLLQKASAAVDLINLRSEFSNVTNQSVTGKFVTVIIETTPDFIEKLEQ
mmetsp:Transcript_10056/g.16938  ORF Transcript_10056/g.16938 Transcript_10056/m.16938 type:complete len:128 (-) Transcript_10056:835-1218(-)